MQLTTVQLGSIVITLVLTILPGIYAGRKVKSADDFALGGRSAGIDMETIPLFTLLHKFYYFVKFFLLFAFMQSTIISARSIKVLFSYYFPVLQL